MKQLHNILRKMSLSVAPRMESTALIRHREQSDVFLCGRTQERKWQRELVGQRKSVVRIKSVVSDELVETMSGRYSLYSCFYSVIFIEPL